jgi:hypothetical protein
VTASLTSFSAGSIQVTVNQTFARKDREAEIAAVPENVVEVEGRLQRKDRRRKRKQLWWRNGSVGRAGG